MIVVLSILAVTAIQLTYPQKPNPLTRRYMVSVKEDAVEGSILFSPSDEHKNGLYTAGFSDNLAQYLNLDQQTGVISLAMPLDREELADIGVCKPTSKCVIPILLKNEENQRLYSIEIHVEDVNDNTPQFETQNFTISLKENVPIGYSFFTQTASDKDFNENCSITYQLVSEDSSTSIFWLANPLIPTIVVNRTLDYETKKQYCLKLIATDCGDPVRYAELMLIIKVEDVNDNAPQCVRTKTLITVPEDKPVNSTITNIEAFDRDSGQNAQLDFRILPNNFDAITTFGVNRSNGDIILLRPLDFESIRKYNIEIWVSDKGDVPLTTTCSLEIEVYNVNDNNPVADVTIFPKFRTQTKHISKHNITSYLLSLSEDLKPGTIVGQLYVHDKDEDTIPIQVDILCQPKETLNLSIPDDPILIRSVDKSTYLIYSNSLDREHCDSYRCTLRMIDGGIPPRTTNVTFLIDVLDVNDNPPSFGINSSSITLLIRENQPVGTFVHKFNVTDADQANTGNGMVRIYGNSNEFSINEITGELRSKVVFDREHQSEYKFDLTAYDLSKDRPLKSSILVIVKIQDENDNFPTFRFKSYNFSVVENVKIDTVIGRVHATDSDTGDNARLTYYFCKINPPNFPFKVLPDGELRTVGAVDYEKQKLYMSTICVRDGVANTSRNDISLTDETEVMFIIKNLNDNCPRIHFPDSKVAFLNTDERASRQWNYTLRINDADGDLDKITVTVSHPSMVIQYQKDDVYTLSFPFIVPLPGQYIVSVTARDEQLCNTSSYFILVVGDQTTDRIAAISKAKQDLIAFEQKQQQMRPKDKRQSSATNVGLQRSKIELIPVSNIMIALPALILLLVALMALLVVIVSSRRKRHDAYWSNTDFESDSEDKGDIDFDLSRKSSTHTNDGLQKLKNVTPANGISIQKPRRNISSKDWNDTSHNQKFNSHSDHFGEKFMFKSISDQSFCEHGRDHTSSVETPKPWIANRFGFQTTQFDTYSKPLPRRWTTFSTGPDEITI